MLAVAAVWGSSYALAKDATAQLPVLEFLALRFGLTFLVLLPALRALWQVGGRAGLAVAGVLGANLLAVFICETFGVSLTSASHAAFLISLCVAFTPWVEWAVLGERPSARMVIATLGSVAGAALLAAPAVHDADALRGDALMVVAAVLRAVMVCLTRRLAAPLALPALGLTAAQAGVMAAALVGLCALGPGDAWQRVPVAPSFWATLAFLVIFCTVLAFFAQNAAASAMSPTRVSLLMGCEPVFGALFAAVWLGERVPAVGWAGGLVIVVATLWGTVRKQPDGGPVPSATGPVHPVRSGG